MNKGRRWRNIAINAGVLIEERDASPVSGCWGQGTQTVPRCAGSNPARCPKIKEIEK